MRHCKDCEPAQESHFVAYTSVVLGWIDEPIFNLLERVFKNAAERVADEITLPFFKTMVFLRLGHWTDKPDNQDTYRTKCFWDEAERRGIKMREFHLGPIKDGFMAEYKGEILTFDGLEEPYTIGQHFAAPPQDSSSSIPSMNRCAVMSQKDLSKNLRIMSSCASC